MESATHNFNTNTPNKIEDNLMIGDGPVIFHHKTTLPNILKGECQDDKSDCSSLSSDDDTTIVNEDDNDSSNSSDEGPMSADAVTPTKKELETMCVKGVPGVQFSSSTEEEIRELKYRLSKSTKKVELLKYECSMSQEKYSILAKKCSVLEARLASNKEDGGEQFGTLEKLQAKNAALMEESAMWNNVNDRHAFLIKDLRTKNAKLNEEKVQMEVEFINQLSSLSEEKKKIINDNEEQFKLKIDSIVCLRKQVFLQHNQIKKLEAGICLLQRVKNVGTDEKILESEEELSTKMSKLGKENTLLKSDLKTLADENKSLHEEVAELRDRVVRLTNVEISVVPELENQLESYRSTLAELEEDVKHIVEGKVATDLEKTLLADEIINKSTRIASFDLENGQLKARLKTATNENKHLLEEIMELRDRVVRLSNIEIDVVPELHNQLDASRSALRALEQDMQLMSEEKTSTEYNLRKGLANADQNKCQMEEEILNFSMDLENEKKKIVHKLAKENEEKDATIAFLQTEIASWKEKVICREKNSELDSISSQGEVDTFRQMYLSAVSKLSKQKEMAEAMRKLLEERDVLNAALVNKLEKLKESTSLEEE